MHNLDNDLLLYGDAELLDRALAVVLNSRQSKIPVGDDAWVQSTVDAVYSIANDDYTLVASIGMNTWELALYAASRAGCRCVILIPAEKGEPVEHMAQRISDDFNLECTSHCWIAIPAAPKSRSRKAWWDRRDMLALNLADRFYPVSIRENGRWAEFIESPGMRNKSFSKLFMTEYTRSRKSIPIVPKGLQVSTVRPWQYITHWTRRSHGPWPGESSFEYYRSIVESDGEYSHSARESLRRILEAGTIRGSSSRIRGGETVVAFTALAPDEALPLMKWRPRFVRPTFEPYGVAINVQAARRAGIKPVEYLPGGIESHSTPRALQQGFGRGDWPKESEWRALEDVNLSKFEINDVRVLVPLEKDKPFFPHSTNFTVVAFNEIK